MLLVRDTAVDAIHLCVYMCRLSCVGRLVTGIPPVGSRDTQENIQWDDSTKPGNEKSSHGYCEHARQC